MVPTERMVCTWQDTLKAMKRDNVDLSVIVPWDFMRYDRIRKENDCVIEAISRYPDRFVGIMQINPLEPELALEEIDRCLSSLVLFLQ